MRYILSLTCIFLLVAFTALVGLIRLDLVGLIRLDLNGTIILSKAVSLPFCTRFQLQKGKWIKSNDALPYPVDSEKCNNSNYNASETYDWQPDEHRSCRFEKFNSTKFCTLLKEATILFVGDSLTF